MRLREFSALDERYYEETLANGLRIRVIPKPGFSRSFAVFTVDYGAIDTKFSRAGESITTPDGVAHYLEHKMFDMPYGDAMNRFAEYSGSPNAFTTYSMTAYYVECTDCLEENLRTLLEMVSTPLFTQKSVDKERGIIEQEIRMYEDSPDSRIYDNLFRAMYRHHPIRVPIAGTVESIQAITPAILTDCHRGFYAPANAMLCVEGDVDPVRVMELAKAILPAEKTAIADRDYGPAEAVTPVEKRVEDTMEVAMPSFLVGFKHEPPKPGREAMRLEFIGDLAADLLLGPSAPLYTELYEAGRIDQGFSAGYEGLKGVSMFSAGGDSREPDAVVEAILKEAERVSREGFDEALFRRQQKATLGHKVRELDSFESTCIRMCEYGFDGMDYLEFDEVFRSITQADVEQFVKECIRAERACISVIRPKA